MLRAVLPVAAIAVMVVLYLDVLLPFVAQWSSAFQRIAASIPG